ncbi:MAG: DUF3568 family protein [Phycisphaerae bacterium]|nr:DUF3568 family protein [Tepidisphaeraceae bacterium]
MHTRPLIAALALGALALTQSGCLLAVAAVGTGATVAYVRGDTESAMDAAPDRVTAAAKAALEDLKIVVVSSHASALDGDVVGRTAGDDKVHIVVKAQGERTSHISIRIGTFGDQAISNRILLKVNERLSDMNAGAAPAPQSAAVSAPLATPAVVPED